MRLASGETTRTVIGANEPSVTDRVADRCASPVLLHLHGHRFQLGVPCLVVVLAVGLLLGASFVGPVSSASPGEGLVFVNGVVVGVAVVSVARDAAKPRVASAVGLYDARPTAFGAQLWLHGSPEKEESAAMESSLSKAGALQTTQSAAVVKITATPATLAQAPDRARGIT